MIIKNTSVETQHPWPEDMFIQGGSSGLVFRSMAQGGNYGTAFVEVHHALCGFIRGEGPTVAEAETAAWTQFQTVTACSGHEWEPRNHKNGHGFCKRCGIFSSEKVFTGQELGQFCTVCGEPTLFDWWGGKFFCRDHAPTGEQRKELYRQGVSGYEPGSLSDALERLALREYDDNID